MGQTLKDWTISLEELKKFEKDYTVSPSSKIVPCGCGVKVDLNDIVYPTIQSFSKNNSLYNNERLDAFFATGELESIQRIVIPLNSNASQIQNAAKEIFNYRPDILLELMTVDFESVESDVDKKKKFELIYKLKCDLLDQVRSHYSQNQIPYAVQFGKGHSIRAGGDFIMFDLVKMQPNKKLGVYSAFNHDTIITADSVLKHSSLITTFVSFNNALNDLFSNGVYQKLEIFPVYDGNDEEVSNIQNNMNYFIQFYQKRGVEIKLHDKGPLNKGLRMIGATVVGQSNKMKRKFDQLCKGDQLILTKHLGDLAYLNLFRKNYFGSKVSVNTDENRYLVLQQMTISNYLIAKVINQYLPSSTDEFDSNSHISFSSDISGPGVDVIFEAAQMSQIKLKMNAPIFLFPQSLYHFRKNHTSSTNGPLVIAGSESVIQKIKSDLARLGFDRLWEIANVEK